MRNVIQLCFPANNILYMRKWNHAFLLLAIAVGCSWQIASPPEDIPQTRWSNDKTVIELGYCKISWFVSVWYSTSVIAGLFDVELALQSAILFYYLFYYFCHTQWITSRIKTKINRLINIKFKICTFLGRSDCGGEISEKPSLWGIEISPTGNLNTRRHFKK